MAGVCSVASGVASDAPYAWTESDHGPFEFGAAVALVKGCSPARALDVLGARRATQVGPARALRDWAAQQDYQHYGTAVEAGAISGWTVVIELNGYQATLPELLEALSGGGEAVKLEGAGCGQAQQSFDQEHSKLVRGLHLEEFIHRNEQ